MKFCYVDESGTGDEPFAVMVGVIVDAQRMLPTKADWRQLLARLEKVIGRPVREIHTRDFYAGNSPWRDIAGSQRKQIIDEIFDWLTGRKHRIVYVAVEKMTFYASRHNDVRLREIETLWRHLALHLVLSIQRAHQGEEKNKGNTVLIFDNEHREQLKFTELILNPPSWTDTYYRRKKKQDALDQIIDVPFFADSEGVPLLQTADFLAYFFRRFCELESGDRQKYEGESELVRGWVSKAMERSIPGSAIYPKRDRCACADLFHSLAPNCLRNI